MDMHRKWKSPILLFKEELKIQVFDQMPQWIDLAYIVIIDCWILIVRSISLVGNSWLCVIIEEDWLWVIIEWLVKIDCDCGRLIIVWEYIIMAPKIKFGAGSSQSFDASKFISYETQKKFIDQLRIHVIQERGLVQKLQHRVNWTIDRKYCVNIPTQPLFLL